MNKNLQRRWFQFSLSSYLILTAIIAWGLAVWPWFTAVPISYAYAIAIKPAALGPLSALLVFITWRLLRRGLAFHHALRTRQSNDETEALER